MARIRALKIGFFRNEHLAAFGFAHRLLFEGLWVLADSQGRLEDRPKRIHADLFPFDSELNVDKMLDDLASGDDPFIDRYEVDGRRYVQVLNFHKHQRPHHREPESEIPPNSVKPGQSRALAVLKHVPAPDQPAGSGKGMGNGSGNGEGDDAAASGPSELREAWNKRTTPPIRKCSALTPARRQLAAVRLREAAFDVWVLVIDRIEASAFCRGETERGNWIANFDWLLKQGTRVKVLEGQYDNTKAVSGYRPALVRNYMAWADECADMGHDPPCVDQNTHSIEVFKGEQKAAAS